VNRNSFLDDIHIDIACRQFRQLIKQCIGLGQQKTQLSDGNTGKLL
jgi:hypothetical protein